LWPENKLLNETEINENDAKIQKQKHLGYTIQEAPLPRRAQRVRRA